MDNTYFEEYGDLSVCSVTTEQHERTGNCWYIVRNASMAHTGFATAEQLYEWLDVRGLQLAQPLPADRGVYSDSPIQGRYRSASHMNVQEFLAIEPLVMIPIISNGRYTLAKITTDDDRIRTVHLLNPNSTAGVFPWDTASLGSITRLHPSHNREEQLVADYIDEVLPAREVLANKAVGHWRVCARVVHIDRDHFDYRRLMFTTPWFEIWNNPELGIVADTMEKVEQLVRERYAAFIPDGHEIYITAFPVAACRSL